MRLMDLHRELTRLVDALEDVGAEYALCGGLALDVHGHPRFTKDIDLLVPTDAMEQVVAQDRNLGYIIDAGLIPFDSKGPRAREVRRLSKVEGKELLTLDLLVLPPFLDRVWAEREEFEWEGRILRVVSRRGLVEMKRIAGRTQDLADLEVLEGDADD